MSFCQDELTTKTNELAQTREQLAEMTNAAVSKEQKLLSDLETLNEQNENILHSEIQRFNKECDEKVLTLQEMYTAEIASLRDDVQCKMADAIQQHESQLEVQAEQFQTKSDAACLLATAEKGELQEKFTRKAADCDRLRTETDAKLKSKELELTSKTRIINQLGRRIETQQKLIDYMMKSLDAERSRHNSCSSVNGGGLSPSGDVDRLLSNLQSSLDDKLQQNPLAGEIYQYRQSLSSASSVQDLSLMLPVSPSRSSSPNRNRGGAGVRGGAASTSEAAMSPIPSPTPSPMFADHRSPQNNNNNNDFNLYLRSSTSTSPRETHNQTFPLPSPSFSFSGPQSSSSQSMRNKYPASGSQHYKQQHDIATGKTNSSNQNEQLSKSLPLMLSDNVFVDHGYVSPTHQQNVTTKTVYFGEQIQTIMRTFEKLELMHEGEDSSSISPNSRELDLEVWKQKIHFRLKVLDDQMNEIDDDRSKSTSSASLQSGENAVEKTGKPTTPLLGGEEGGVIFHPSTREIRELIENVNRRYKKLGQKYLTPSQVEIQQQS